MSSAIFPDRDPETPESRTRRWRQEAADSWNFTLWWFHRLWLFYWPGGRISAGREQLMQDNANNPKVQRYYFFCHTEENGEPHGLQIDYEHGHDHIVRCPVCEQRWHESRPHAKPLAA